MAGEVLDWINNHIWVPIVASLVVIVLLTLMVWLICRVCRNWRRYDYTALEEDLALPEKMRLERKLQQDASRDSALMNCGFYLRSKRSYTLINHLNDIGFRVDSQWFMVSDVRTKSQNILTMFPCPSKIIPPFSTTTQKTLSELFLLLQHPYLYPISEIDFIQEQGLIATVHPYNTAGSLKDLIYKSKCLNPWSSKYTYKGQGLQVRLIQMFGKQILQALMFLESKGLPPHCHLHSGNVMIHNRVCRIAGYENNLLGIPPRLLPLVKRKLKDGKKEDIDSICFGHLLYEMSAGCVLDTPTPEPRHLVNCPHDVIQVLNFIFPPEGGSVPSITEIHSHSFFQFVRLKEAEMFNIAPIHFSSNVKTLIKAVKKGKPYKSKSRKKSSTSETESYRSSRQNSVMQEEETVFGPPEPPVAPPPPPFAPPPPIAPPPPKAPDSPAPGGPPSYSSATSERGALLSAIRGGAQLKKADTNDRSAPKV